MAHLRAGTPAAAATGAGVRTPRLRKYLGEQGRKRGLPVAVRQQLLDAICAGRPFRTVVRELNLTPNQIWGLTITLDFGDRKIILLPGTNATLTNATTGESVQVAIPGPEFDTDINSDGTPATFTATGPWLWLAFNPANQDQEGLFLTHGQVVINTSTGLPIDVKGSSRNLCTELAA
jgi:hypothetical protein